MASQRTRSGAVGRALAATLAVAGSGCGSEQPAALTVGPVSYTEDRLLGLSDDRRRTLGELTALGLAVADSSTEALGAPLVQEWVDDRRLEILAAELTLERHGIGDDVLEAAYLTDPEWELTVRHILFFSERWRSDEHRAAARAKATRAMEALRAGADFAETAAALSEEPGAEGRQGLLTPGREGSWVPEFWAAALVLEPGEISPVTETQYGYHILRLEDRRVVPFVEARSVVARRVADEVDDPEAVLAAWTDSVASDGGSTRRVALEEADRRGLGVPEAERAELARAWSDRVQRWATTFAFRVGLAPSQVADVAFSALSDPAQNATLARSEVREHADLLAARYPIRLGSGDR